MLLSEPNKGTEVPFSFQLKLSCPYLDYQATDTVTNFTTLIAQFKQHNIRHLYVVTSDFHMPRAKVIGSIVLVQSSMTFTPVIMPTNERAESWLRIARDGGRSILWTMTGQTGEYIGRKLEAKLSQISANPFNN
ncbi:YdcF family protein [Leptothoe sp. LEGE 181152]|nr:YdcF family protein [Leptothoe sp. LEGE 181152]